MFDWLLLLIGYLPFQIAINPGYGFDLASLRLFIVVFFIIWFFKKAKEGNFEIGAYLNNLQSIGLLSFLILISLSLIGAANPFWGVRKIIYFLSVFPLYFIVINLVDEWYKIKKVIYFLLAGGGIFATAGLAQFLAQFFFSFEKIYNFWAINIISVFSGFNYGSMLLSYPSWLVEINGRVFSRAFSLFSDPHMLAFYLGLILPLAFSLLVHQWVAKHQHSFIFYSLYFLFFVVLLLTFTRGAYMAVIAVFSVLIFLSWRYLNVRGLIFLLLLSLLVFIIPITPIADRFYSSFNTQEESNIGRLSMWQEAGKAGLENPLVGVGLGNYSLIIDSKLDYRNPITAHNLYLDLFSETGALSLLVWLVLILGTAWQLLRRIIKVNDSPKRAILIGLAGSLLYFFCHSFFETAVYNPSILAVFMVLLGLSTALLRSAPEKR